MPHFMILLITYINLLNFFLDNKMSIFEEYGAFKAGMCIIQHFFYFFLEFCSFFKVFQFFVIPSNHLY